MPGPCPPLCAPLCPPLCPPLCVPVCVGGPTSLNAGCAAVPCPARWEGCRWGSTGDSSRCARAGHANRGACEGAYRKGRLWANGPLGNRAMRRPPGRTNGPQRPMGRELKPRRLRLDWQTRPSELIRLRLHIVCRTDGCPALIARLRELLPNANDARSKRPLSDRCAGLSAWRSTRSVNL